MKILKTGKTISGEPSILYQNDKGVLVADTFKLEEVDTTDIERNYLLDLEFDVMLSMLPWIEVDPGGDLDYIHRIGHFDEGLRFGCFEIQTNIHVKAEKIPTGVREIDGRNHRIENTVTIADTHLMKDEISILLNPDQRERLDKEIKNKTIVL